MISSIKMQAHAKLNLTLEVLGKRPDGYHELRSVMQTIDLADEIVVKPADSIEFECSEQALAGPDNLVYRAARLFREASETRRGAHIRLIKRIPAAGGLGGGSSDAAAVLIALNQLWQAGWERADLAALGAHLGSDVPFFFTGGTALVSGRGEIVEPLPPLPPTTFVLLLPNVEFPEKTKRVFGETTPDDYRNGSATSQVATALGQGVLRTELLVNGLTEPIFRAFPAIRADLRALRAVGAEQPMLSGAGPTCFAIAPGRDVAEHWVERLYSLGRNAMVALPYDMRP